MSSWLDDVQFNRDGLIPAIAQHHQTGRVLMVAWMNRESLRLTAEKNQAVYFSRSRQKLWHKGEESGHFQTVHEIRLDCDADVIVLQVEQHGGIACHTGRESCFYRVLGQNGWQIVDAQLKDPQQIYAQGDDDPVQEPIQDAVKDHLENLAQNFSQEHASALNTTDEQSVAHVTDQTDVLVYLSHLMQQRKHAAADSSYVASLYQKGLNKILEKVGEESIESILAAKEFANHASRENHDDLIYETADLWFHSIVMLGYFNLSPQLVLDELARRQGLSGLVEKANRHSG